MFFEKLNKAWQEAINKEIADSMGEEHPDIVAAWREHYARYLNEIVISARPFKKDFGEIGSSLIEFHDGWEALLKTITTDQRKVIAAWVRAKGKPTDYNDLSDLEDNEYPAFIIKESDVIELEKGKAA